MAVIKIKTSALTSGVNATKYSPSNTSLATGALDKGELAFSYANGILVIGTATVGNAVNASNTTIVNKVIGGSAFFHEDSSGRQGTGDNVLATGPTISGATLTGTVSITGASATTSLTVGADTTPVATTLYGTLTVGSDNYQKATILYGNLTVGVSGGTVEATLLNGTLAVTGNTTLSGGTVILADATTIKGTGTTASSAILTIQPGNAVNAGTLAVSGNLSVSSTIVTLADATTIKGTGTTVTSAILTIQPGSTADGGTLAVSGNVSISGNLNVGTTNSGKITVRGVDITNGTITSPITVSTFDHAIPGATAPARNSVTATAFKVSDATLSGYALTVMAAGYIQTGTVMADFLMGPVGGRISGISAHTIEVFQHPTVSNLNGEISANRLKIIAADASTQKALIDIDGNITANKLTLGSATAGSTAGDIATSGSVTAASFSATGTSTFSGVTSFSYGNGIGFKDFSDTASSGASPSYFLRPPTTDLTSATGIHTFLLPVTAGTTNTSTDSLVSLTSSDVLTNKTLTSPIITDSTTILGTVAGAGATITIKPSTTPTAGILVLTANTTVGGRLTITEVATTTTPWSTALAIAPAAHTGVTAETPAFSVAANTLTIAGAFTNQRFNRFTAPTINGTYTVTTAATVAITGAPAVTAAFAGTVISNNYALLVEAGDVRLAGETILSGAIAGNISADNISLTSLSAGTIFNSTNSNDFNKVFTAVSGTGSTITFAAAPTPPTGAVLVGSLINGAGITAGTTISNINSFTLTLSAAVGTITATSYIISFARTITATAGSATCSTSATTATLTIPALAYIVYAGSMITGTGIPAYSYVSAYAAVGATSLAVTFGSALGAGISTASVPFTIIHARHFLSAAISGSSGSSIIPAGSGLVGGSIIYRNSYIFGVGITALTTITKTTESATVATALRLSNPLTAAITASAYVIINMVPAVTISSTGDFTTSGALLVESGDVLFKGLIKAGSGLVSITDSTGKLSLGSSTVTGTLPVTSGGTGLSSGYVLGDMLYVSASTPTIARLPIMSTGYILAGGTIPGWTNTPQVAQLYLNSTSNQLVYTAGAGGYFGTLSWPSVTVASKTITLPDLAGTVMLTSGTQTIGTGVAWNGTIITPAYGGTGVDNGVKTITLGGNFVTAGAYATTLTVTAATNVTLPTTGIVVTKDSTDILTNKTFDTAGTGNILKINGTGISAVTGTSGGAVVLATSPTITTPTIAEIRGSSGALALYGNINADGAAVITLRSGSGSPTVTVHNTGLTAAGTLAVTGAATFASTLSVTTISLTSLAGALTVTGVATLNGGLALGGNTVTGAATFTGGPSFTTTNPTTITPTQDTHIANKLYVDTVAQGLHVHPPADVILLAGLSDSSAPNSLLNNRTSYAYANDGQSITINSTTNNLTWVVDGLPIFDIDLITSGSSNPSGSNSLTITSFTAASPVSIPAGTPISGGGIATGTLTTTAFSSQAAITSIGLSKATTGNTTTGTTITVACGWTRIVIGGETSTTASTTSPNTEWHGIYTKGTISGTVPNAVSQIILNRAADANTLPELSGGDFIFIQRGLTYADTGFVQSVSTILTTTWANDNGFKPMFLQFSQAGVILPGTGLTKSGNTLTVASITHLTAVGTISTGTIDGGTF